MHGRILSLPFSATPTSLYIIHYKNPTLDEDMTRTHGFRRNIAQWWHQRMGGTLFKSCSRLYKQHVATCFFVVFFFCKVADHSCSQDWQCPGKASHTPHPYRMILLHSRGAQPFLFQWPWFRDKTYMPSAIEKNQCLGQICTHRCNRSLHFDVSSQRKGSGLQQRHCQGQGSSSY